LNAASTAPVAWTAEQLLIYLRKGFVEPHGVAAGPMRDIPNNLGEAPADDVKAIAEYVGSLLAPATAGRSERRRGPEARPEGPNASAEPTSTVGQGGAASRDAATIYAGACAGCHEPSGQRFSAMGIPLADSKVIAMPDPRNLIHVVVEGIEPPDGTPTASMPGFGAAFTQEQLAELAKFLRAQFSDQPPWKDMEKRVNDVLRGTP
jgi:nicotinate dehydrogenase subunit B